MNMAVYNKPVKDILGTPPLASSEAPATLQKLSETLALY